MGIWVGVLLALSWFGGVLLNPHVEALGGGWTEAPGHLWGLWVAADGLWSHGPYVRDAALGFPGTYRVHLMDPVNLLPFLPGYWLGGGGAMGATLGWNLLHLVALGVALWGCLMLRRVLLPAGSEQRRPPSSPSDSAPSPWLRCRRQSRR